MLHTPRESVSTESNGVKRYLYAFVLDFNDSLDSMTDITDAYIGPEALQALKTKHRLMNKPYDIPSTCMNAVSALGALQLRSRYCTGSGPYYVWSATPIDRALLSEYIESRKNLSHDGIEGLKRACKRP